MPLYMPMAPHRSDQKRKKYVSQRWLGGTSPNWKWRCTNYPFGI